MLEILTASAIKEYSEKAAKELVEAIGRINKKGQKAVGDGEFEVVASTAGVDRDGEIIKIEAWDTDNFMKNPVVLFGHDYWSLPIGVVTSLEVKGDQLIAKGIFAKTEAAQEIRRLYDDGILKAVSVGFIVKNREGYIITEAELLELSFVPVPANADALSLSKMKKTINFFKSACPSVETPMMDKASEWDATKAEENLKVWATTQDADGNDVMDWAKYKQGFAWFNDDEQEKPESYKLVHHDIVDGELKVNWLGCVAAMGALLGGNSGVLDADKQAVYDHLALHYKQFEQEAPELKSYTQYEIDTLFGEKSPEAEKVIDSFFADVKALYTAAKADIQALGVDAKEVNKKEGRVLSAKNRLAIENAIKVLTDILTLAEPEKAETAETLKGIKDLLQSIDKLGEKAILEVKKALE